MRLIVVDGHDFERQFFGKAGKDVNRELSKVRARNFEEALEFARYSQPYIPWNPRKPGTHLSRMMFNRVARNLPHGDRELRLFVTVGLRLDLMGVDCFFEYDHRVVTVDITTRPFKKNPRANVILTLDDMLRDRHYQIGDRIARYLTYN